jgi:methylglutaconyl-CoA hydratase
MPSPAPPTVTIELAGTVAWLRMQRPEVHNAFDVALVADLTAALIALDADPGVRAVVLTGAGSTFSAGADLNWMRDMAAASEAGNREDSLRLATLMRTLDELSKPTVARVNGSAYGGGVGLVACCDIAIGVDGAKFSLSELKLGLVPAVISPYVLSAIGPRQARRLFLGAEVIDAAEAARIGLLHACVPAGELDAAVDRCLHWLGKGGPIAQREAKALVHRLAGAHVGAHVGADGGAGSAVDGLTALDRDNAALIARLRVSPEGQEGLGAFLAKRPPAWVVTE